MSYVTTATPEEISFAKEFGSVRNREAEKLGGQNRNGLTVDPGDYYSINGVLGEVIYRRFKHLSCELTLNTFKHRSDFPNDVEIRTLGEHWYKLWVRPDDNPNHRYVLITGHLPSPVFRIHGWAFGWEVIQNNHPENYAGRPTIWTMEQEKLHSMATLP
jgi:hypothetical protein